MFILNDYLLGSTRPLFVFDISICLCFLYTLSSPDFSNLGQHDIIPESGVLPDHIRTGNARKTYVTPQEACITGSESTL